MTANEIKYILNKANETSALNGEFTELPNIRYFVIDKLEVKIPSKDSWRYLFDFENSLLYIYSIKIENGEYKFVKDANGENLLDVYDFSSIIMISPYSVKGE